MSVKPDFTMMTTPQLQAYVLEHRADDEALQAYLDKRHSKNPNSRVCEAKDNVAGQSQNTCIVKGIKKPSKTVNI